MAGLLGGSVALAQTPPPVKVSLALKSQALNQPQPTFILGDPDDEVEVTLTIENIGAPNIITSLGFSDERFELNLVFMDPQGKGIIANDVINKVEGDPPPPKVLFDPVGIAVQVEKVEVLKGTASGTPFRLQVTIPDARTFYTLVSSGFYTVKAVIPFRTYARIFRRITPDLYARIDAAAFQGELVSNTVRFALASDADNDGYSFPVADNRISQNNEADCNDQDANVNPGAAEIPNNGVDDDCNPDTPDLVVEAPGTLVVEAVLRSTGDSIPGLSVRAFETLSACVQGLGLAPAQFRSIWLSCVPLGTGQTDGAGRVSFEVPGGNYLAIGEYPPGSAFGQGENYPGATGAVVSGEQTLVRIEAVARCDVDSNGAIDINDIRAIMLRRNQPAASHDDPADADGDGVVTVNDARQCVLRCDNPRCAP